MAAVDLLVGDRIVRPGEPVLELLVDGTWAPVCVVNDAAMAAYNEASELCCAVCGGTYREVMAIA